MGARKIQDEQEIVKWFEQGKTYEWMVAEYRRKYNLETVPSMFGNFRRRRGLGRRIVRNDDLIPWAVNREHRWLYPVMMLRAAAAQREGKELPERTMERLERWLEERKAEDSVVHYDPETEEGFFYVPRRPGVDTDLIRVPDRKTTQRKAAD